MGEIIRRGEHGHKRILLAAQDARHWCANSPRLGKKNACMMGRPLARSSKNLPDDLSPRRWPGAIPVGASGSGGFLPPAACLSSSLSAERPMNPVRWCFYAGCWLVLASPAITVQTPVKKESEPAKTSY